MPSKITVGCCGYSYYRPGKGWKEKYEHKLQAYADQYPSVEINSTFYKLPRVSTAQKWKRLAEKVNDTFIFTVKANQRITHPPSSPTYKKAKLKIPEGREDRYGFFRSTDEVFKAWKETQKVVEALHAEVCLFQCPPSFKPAKENLENLRNFFSQVQGVKMALEPRNEKWTQNTVHKICQKHRVIHAVDPFKRKPASDTSTVYFRLHGLGKRKYKYKFSNPDLKKLFDICQNQEAEEVLVMFNNYQLHPDAKRFLHLVEKGELEKVPWKAEAVADTVKIDFPTSKEKILKKCGRWWCWIEPDKSIRVRQALKHVQKEEFEDKEQLLQTVRKIYHKI